MPSWLERRGRPSLTKKRNRRQLRFPLRRAKRRRQGRLARRNSKAPWRTTSRPSEEMTPGRKTSRREDPPAIGARGQPPQKRQKRQQRPLRPRHIRVLARPPSRRRWRPNRNRLKAATFQRWVPLPQSSGAQRRRLLWRPMVSPRLPKRPPPRTTGPRSLASKTETTRQKETTRVPTRSRLRPRPRRTMTTKMTRTTSSLPWLVTRLEGLRNADFSHILLGRVHRQRFSTMLAYSLIPKLSLLGTSLL
mmetsp:Transcript_43854/g.121341  ORF Transcript_43854/g.121341 Transcript_43854/m.121341 type:complete len:248 (+) Transcript_43854:2293-3036(+)